MNFTTPPPPLTGHSMPATTTASAAGNQLPSDNEQAPPSATARRNHGSLLSGLSPREKFVEAARQARKPIVLYRGAPGDNIEADLASPYVRQADDPGAQARAEDFLDELYKNPGLLQHYQQCHSRNSQRMLDRPDMGSNLGSCFVSLSDDESISKRFATNDAAGHPRPSGGTLYTITTERGRVMQNTSSPYPIENEYLMPVKVNRDQVTRIETITDPSSPALPQPSAFPSRWPGDA